MPPGTARWIEGAQPGRWEGGHLYDPESGAPYAVSAQVNASRLRLRIVVPENGSAFDLNWRRVMNSGFLARGKDADIVLIDACDGGGARSRFNPERFVTQNVEALWAQNFSLLVGQTLE